MFSNSAIRHHASPLSGVDAYLLGVTLVGCALLGAVAVDSASTFLPARRPSSGCSRAWRCSARCSPSRCAATTRSRARPRSCSRCLLLFGTTAAVLAQTASSLLTSAPRPQAGAADELRSRAADDLRRGRRRAALGSHGSAASGCLAPDRRLRGAWACSSPGGAYFLTTNLLALRGSGVARGGVAAWILQRDLTLQVLTAAVFISLAPIILLAAHVDLSLCLLLLLPMIAIYKGGREAVMNEHRATHDLLTGLPNRVLFTDRIDQAVKLARRERTVRRGPVPGPRPFQGDQRHARPPPRRPAAAHARADGCGRCCVRATRSRGSAATSSASCCRTPTPAQASPCGGKDPRCACKRPLRGRGAHPPGRRQHRDRVLPDARSRRDDAAAARGRRHVRGQGEPQWIRGLQRRPRHPEHRAGDAGKRPAQRGRRPASSCSSISRSSTSGPSVWSASRRSHAGSRPRGAGQPGRVHTRSRSRSACIKPLTMRLLGQALDGVARLGGGRRGLVLAVNVSARHLMSRDFVEEIEDLLRALGNHAVEPQAGDHGDDHHGRPVSRRGRGAGAERARGEGRDRRLRHRLFVARIPEAACPWTR